MSRILALTLLAGLALTLGACGGDGDDVADDPAPSTSSSTPPPSTPGAPSPSNTGPLPPDVPKDGGETVTVTGRTSLGVEPGCTLLEGDGRVYLLLGGGVATVGDGVIVRVTGTVNPGMMSTCQQGTPLQVTSFELLPRR